MKKLILAAALLYGAVGFGQNFQTKHFLNGFAVQVGTNTTLIYGATNVGYGNLGTNFVFSLTNAYIKGTFAGTSNGTPISTSMASLWWTNAITTSTNADGTVLQTWGPAWNDVPVWSDRNGNTPVGLSIAITTLGTNSVGTNGTVLTFVGLASGGLNYDGSPAYGTVPPGITFPGNSGSSPQFVVRVVPGGTTFKTVITNVPTALIQGVGALRLLSVAGDATGTTSTPTFLMDVSLQGYYP